MVRKYFSLAGVAALGGLVWMGCSSDDDKVGPGNGADAGSDSGDGANEDAGDPDSSKPDSSAPKPGVDIAYGKCPAFEKCGGELLGDWKVTGGCLSEDTFAKAKEACGIEERDVVIKAEGTVKVTAENVERKTTIYLDGKVKIPKACATGLPITPSCDLFEAFLKGATPPVGNVPPIPKFDEATCTDLGDACDCAASTALREDSSDEYTTEDGVLTTAGAKPMTYEYCVKENKTTYRDTTPTAGGKPPTLQFVIEITKQ